jgi:predicted AAA+ superfamily ATPase
MYIKRDITDQLTEAPTWIQMLLGPRQCGKSTLFAALDQKSDDHFHSVTLDDFKLRQLANRDPALFLEQFTPPLLVDEAQYAPNLFPELKKIVDDIKKDALFHPKRVTKPKALFRLTGSNQILMDKNVKESLVGRASYFYLNTLTVHEILNTLPKTPIKDILFKGGWPELYTQSTLSPVTYLNDYIRSFVEKDIGMSAGIQKLSEFHTVLGLLGARTGQLIDYSDIAKDSGVAAVTVKEWITLLERADLVYTLKPYFNNLNKRLIKSPKLYFLDTGLAIRLQGWSESTPLFNSPQIGSLFETLVLAEIVKFIRNYRKSWQLYFWRTKNGDEVDFILKTNSGDVHTFEAKLSIQRMPDTVNYSPAFRKDFSPTKPLVIVTFGGQSVTLSKECMTLPIAALHDYLLRIQNI